MARTGTVNPCVYMLQCSDGTLYTGSTVNLENRLHAHNHLKSGAKYTRARRPVILVYEEACMDLNAARRREVEIKRMNRSQKVELCKGRMGFDPST